MYNLENIEFFLSSSSTQVPSLDVKISINIDWSLSGKKEQPEMRHHLNSKPMNRFSFYFG